MTGAGSGIGLACSSALAAHGARVLLVDRDAASLARATERVPGSRSLTCDVSDPAAMQQLCDEVLSSEGVPDVVLNNAGIGVAGRFLDTDPEQWRQIVDVNVLGVGYGCRLFGHAMVQRGEGGQIVNTASAAAFAPLANLPAYAATKAAVLMLSECLRAELGPHGIGVSVICPGIVNTNITRASRYAGRPDAEQERIGEHLAALFARRNFSPERVAAEIMAAIGADTPVKVVTPEAKLMRLVSRLSPGLARRLGAIDVLPA